MIYVVINEKGGVGKSTTSAHFLTSYVNQKKLKNNDSSGVIIFEFDEHNDTSKDLINDDSIKIVTVRLDEESLEAGFAEVEFDSDTTDVILDIGGSQNTDGFINGLKDTELSENMVFIVPEVNQRPRGAVNTIHRLRAVVENPKIVLLLNGPTDIEDAKSKFVFVYGDKDMGLEADPISTDKDVVIATIPKSDIALGLANMAASGLGQQSKMYASTGKLSVSKKKQMWGKDGKDCDKKVWMEKTKELYRSKKAFVALKNAQSLFDALDSFEQSSED